MNTNESIEALERFKNRLKAPRQTENEDIIFDSTVNYKWKGNSVTENLEARICLTGYGVNRVILSPGKKINSKSLYLEFNPQYQDYTLSRNGSLIITQIKSEKLGDYEVTIQEK
ncbi:MAG: hypothetical protein WCR42_12990 [bacterium]